MNHQLLSSDLLNKRSYSSKLTCFEETLLENNFCSVQTSQKTIWGFQLEIE